MVNRLPGIVLAVIFAASAATILPRVGTSPGRWAVVVGFGVLVILSLWRAGAALTVALAAVAVGSLVVGRPAAALGAVLTLAGFLSAGRRLGWRRWTGLSAAAVGVMLMTSSVLPALVGLGALVAFDLVTGAAHNRRLVQRLEVIDRPEVMAGAELHVAAFEVLGFRPVAAIPFSVGFGLHPIGTVMVGPDRRSVAVVTDLVQDVTSSFGHLRLETANSAVAPVLDTYLRQAVPGGSAADLVDLHERALRVLAERGLEPDVLDDDGWVELARADNERGLVEMGGRAWSSSLRTSLGAVGSTRALRGDPDVDERIRRWREVPGPGSH